MPEPLPSDWPTAYQGETIAFDPPENVVLRFGGYAGQSVSTQLWRWEVSSGVFSFLGGEIDPVTTNGWPVGCGSFVYDPLRSTMVLMSGSSVWDWSGAAWTKHLELGEASAFAAKLFVAFDNLHGRFAAAGSDGRMWWYGMQRSEYTPAARIPVYDVTTGIAFHEARGTFIVAARSNRIGEWDPVHGTWTELSHTETNSASNPDEYDVCVEELIYLPNKRRAFTHCSNSHVRDFEIDVETNTWYQTLDNSHPYPASPYIGQYLTFDTLRKKIILMNRGGSDRVEVWECDE